MVRTATTHKHISPRTNMATSNNAAVKRHREILQSLNALEDAVNRKSVEKRRKIAALMDTMPEHRKTLARVFISATYEKFSEPITKQYAMKTTVMNPEVSHVNPMVMEAGFNPMFPTEMQPMQSPKKETTKTLSTRQVKGKWKLLIQGRTITPSIDHKGDERDNDEEGSSRALNENEKQEKPIKFTHLFDAIRVEPTGGDMLEWKNDSSTSDAYAFSVEMDDHYIGNSDLSVDVDLHASIPDKTEYMPSSALVKVLFPNMNKIVPITLTQFHENLFSYILKYRLQDPSDLSIINNDQVLEDLFGCKRMLFSTVSDLISSQNLLLPINSENLINPQTFSVMLKRSNMPNIIEGNVEVYVPVMFHDRVRSLLLRIKRKEQEYTSCRSKASRMLAPSNKEEALKKSIERCVSGNGKVEDTQTFLAIIKAAPQGSEVQKFGQIDVRLLDLWSRVETHSSLAKGSRRVTDLILHGSISANRPDPNYN